MKLKNMWKRFWTLDVHNHEGFTLVELIIVIAILAILSTGAIAGYSAYIERANKTADKALVSEIVNVLTMYAYANGIGEGGYVVLPANGEATAEGNAVNQALNDAYGDDKWRTALKLKYGEWDSDMANVLGSYTADQLKDINESSFLTNCSTEGLMKAVNTMTNLASKVIAGTNLDNAATNLERVLGKDVAAPVIKNLNEQGLMNDPTAISNSLVGAMADSMKDMPALKLIANDIAAAYAYGEKNNGDFSAYEQMKKNLEKVSLNELTNRQAASDLLYKGLENSDFYDYINNDPNVLKDEEALLDMMGAVKEISGNFQDKDSLTNSDLFLAGDVLSQVDTYFNSVKALAGMDQATLDTLKNLPAGSVAILIAADGTVTVCPSDVLSA